jgi:hypothetical protein
MARLFPNHLSARVSHEVARAFRKLKKLPDDFSIHHTLAEVRWNPDSPPPDFLVFWQKRFGFLITIASTSQQLAESALQGSLFTQDATITLEELGHPEQEILLTFSKILDANLPLRRLILFPNVSRNTIDTISLQRNSSHDVSFLGLAQLSPEAFPDFLTSLAAEALSDPQILSLRHQFSPEIAVPQTFSAVRSIDRKTNATLTPSLRGIDPLLDRESDPRLTPVERAELHASQTSLFYMAFTRAGQKLVVFSTSQRRLGFFQKLSHRSDEGDRYRHPIRSLFFKRKSSRLKEPPPK